jgi:hypothetical protein
MSKIQLPTSILYKCPGNLCRVLFSKKLVGGTDRQIMLDNNEASIPFSAQPNHSHSISQDSLHSACPCIIEHGNIQSKGAECNSAMASLPIAEQVIYFSQIIYNIVQNRNFVRLLQQSAQQQL